MTYVHGLGDAQEQFAKSWDEKYGWIDELEIICPNCGSTDTPREAFEDNVDGEWSMDCACQGCGKNFNHYYEDDFRP